MNVKSARNCFLITALIINLFAGVSEANLAAEAILEMHDLIMGIADNLRQNAIVYARSLAYFLALIGFILALKDLAIAGNLAMDSIVATSVRYIMIIGFMTWYFGTDANGHLHMTLISRSAATMGQFLVTGVSGAPTIGLYELLMVKLESLEPIYDAINALGWGEFASAMVLSLGVIMITILFFMIAAVYFCVMLEIILIQAAGLFTISFLFIPFFRDMFFGYLKAMLGAGLKIGLMGILLGIIQVLITHWAALLTTVSGAGLIPIVIAMIGANVIFLMVLLAIPGIVSSILSGNVGGGMSLGAGAGAMMAGANAMMTSIRLGKAGVSGAWSAAQTTSGAVKAYQQGSLAAREAGIGGLKAGAIGAKDALSHMMFSGGSNPNKGKSMSSPIGQNTIEYANSSNSGSGAYGAGVKKNAMNQQSDTSRQNSSAASTSFHSAGGTEVSDATGNGSSTQNDVSSQFNAGTGTGTVNKAPMVQDLGLFSGVFGATKMGSSSSPGSQSNFWNGLSSERRIQIAKGYGMTVSGATVVDANAFWSGLSPSERDNIYRRYR